MTHPLFLAPLIAPVVGGVVEVVGDEARHAVAVRRIRVGETVLVSDGVGLAVRGNVAAAEKSRMEVIVDEVLSAPERPVEWTAVQALAKGDRSDLAVEMLTEIGAARIVAWQAQRSIVRWQGERGLRSLEKWRATAREASKQSRRFHVPEVDHADTSAVAALLAEVDVALVLHEDADLDIADVAVPGRGRVVVVIGPEGGIAPGELETFLATGARAVRISDGVLRTSTAGAVALAQLQVLAGRTS